MSSPSCTSTAMNRNSHTGSTRLPTRRHSPSLYMHTGHHKSETMVTLLHVHTLKCCLPLLHPTHFITTCCPPRLPVTRTVLPSGMHSSGLVLPCLLNLTPGCGVPTTRLTFA